MAFQWLGFLDPWWYSPPLLQSPNPKVRPDRPSFPLSTCHVSHSGQHPLTFWTIPLEFWLQFFDPIGNASSTTCYLSLPSCFGPPLPSWILSSTITLNSSHLQLPCLSALSCLLGKTTMLLKSNSTLYLHLGNLSRRENNIPVLIGLTLNS